MKAGHCVFNLYLLLKVCHVFGAEGVDCCQLTFFGGFLSGQIALLGD